MKIVQAMLWYGKELVIDFLHGLFVTKLLIVNVIVAAIFFTLGVVVTLLLS